MTEQAPAPAPVATADPATMTPEAAQAERSALLRDAEFGAKWRAGDAASRQRMESLNRAAFPPEPDEVAAETPAQNARARIEQLRRDPEFVRRYQAGVVDARQEMERLHRQAYGEDGETKTDAAQKPAPEGGQGDGETVVLAKQPGVDDAKHAEATREAGEIIKTLAVDPVEGNAIVQAIEGSLAERMDGSALRMWSEDETTQFDAMMTARWGAEHDAKLARVDAALGKLSQAQRTWVQNSLRAADPSVAASVFAWIADHA